MFGIDVKELGKRRWVSLSGTAMEPFDKLDMIAHAQQYAMDRQINPDVVAVRCVDRRGREIVSMIPSAAAENSDGRLVD